MNRSDNTERRTIEIRDLQIGEGAGEDNGPTIAGYAAIFNALSDDLGGFREIIEPGFFDKVLTGDVRALWNHDRQLVLGRTTNNTLELAQDEKGLSFLIRPPATTWANDALASLRRGDVNQSSFAFWVADGGESWTTENGVFVRRLLRGGCEALIDVSPVTFPAYPQTSVGVRSQVDRLLEQAEAMAPAGQVAGRGAPGDGPDQGIQRQARGRLLRLLESL